MKPLKMMAVFLLLLPALVQAQKKPKKPVVPAVFAQARYAYVEATDGNEFDPRLFPEDREAIANVENAIRAWGRYDLTMRREEADLVFVVRKGRLATAEGTVGANRLPDANAGPGANTGPGGSTGPIGSTGSGRQAGQYPGQQNDPGTELGARGEVGPPDDLFEVRQRNPDGSMSGPLWMRSLEDGLSGARPMLFVQFKDAVDKAYPPNPPNQPTKP
jgi:hypothetical protein